MNVLSPQAFADYPNAELIGQAEKLYILTLQVPRQTVLRRWLSHTDNRSRQTVGTNLVHTYSDASGDSLFNQLYAAWYDLVTPLQPAGMWYVAENASGGYAIVAREQRRISTSKHPAFCSIMRGPVGSSAMSRLWANHRRITILPVALLLAAASLSGCGEQPLPAGGGADAASQTTDQQLEPPMRLVTLAPALTQMVIDLDETNALVGIAENDMVAPPGLPVVGNFYKVDYERLLAVKPTHVMLMAGSAGPPARLRELADDGRFQLAVYRHPQSIADVAQILYDENAVITQKPNEPANPCVGQMLGKTDLAGELKYQMLQKLADLRKLTANTKHPGVLIVIATQPLVMASGANTVNDQLLGHAGGVNVVGDASVTAPTFDREGLLALQPDVILLMMPGALPLTEDDPRLASFKDMPIAAVNNKRIVLLNDPMIVLPSTNLVQVAGQMAKAIHPSLAVQIDQLFASPRTDTRLEPAKDATVGIHTP